jgi:predicted aspartyl protease
VWLENALNPGGRKEFNALWDTGADISCVSPEVAKTLGLSPVTMIRISTPSDEDVPTHVYLVNLYLPNNIGVSKVRVAEGIPGGCDMLIGMDIITLGDFAVSNMDGCTAFSFRMPSLQKIDFCEHSYFPMSCQSTGGEA